MSSVVDMSRMFECATGFTGNLRSWDVSMITSVERMFSLNGCFFTPIPPVNRAPSSSLGLGLGFNGDISIWNT